MHRELCDDLRAIDQDSAGVLFNLAAPRGNAKTTWIELIFAAFEIVNGRKHFILLIGSTAETANDELAKLKHELEENEDLARDFPMACGRGRLWRDNEIVTRNDIKVAALGAGKRIRGRKHRQYRPDLIIIDDFEDDEHVRNKEQRNKHYNWLLKAVLKAKGVATKCDVIVSGTILHFDSVLARLQDPKASPGWRSKKYKAIVRWADDQALWDRWTALYTDWSKGTEERHADALAFYRANEAAMLAGTEVLWPEGEPYLELQQLIVNEGRRSFDSEKQNEPIDPSECDFPEEWFRWFDEEDIGGETWIAPEKGERVRLADCDEYGACDPSMGKRDKHRDPSAIIRVAAWPARHLWAPTDFAYRKFFVREASIKRRHPHAILEDIYRMHAEWPFQRFGIEAVQFQELFAELAQENALANAATGGLHFIKLTPIGDKGLRIQKLSPFINYGRLLFHRRNCATLHNQLRYHPQADHDDGPDGLELAMETLGAINWTIKIDMPHEPDRSKKSASQQQLEDQIPELAEMAQRRETRGEKLFETCGDCDYFELIRGQEATGVGKCKLRLFNTTKDAAECEHWMRKAED